MLPNQQVAHFITYRLEIASTTEHCWYILERSDLMYTRKEITEQLLGKLM